MDCISDNELVELLEGRLPAERRAHVLAELDRCDACRAVAAGWASASMRFADASPDAPRLDGAGAPAAVAGYRLDALIGAGAMGLVFRGHDPTLDRAVAVKLVRAGGDAADALAEARLLATVRHRHIVTVHAAGTAGGLAYLVMELVDGASLDRFVAEHGVPAWTTAVRWFAGVADGLAAIHAAGVVHRDVKPANLLVDGDELRLADFGLASASGGAPAGTLVYAAPEVVNGEPATPASDQYSFFASLFVALAGRRPYDGVTAGELRAAWRRPLDDSGVPARLRAVVARGLATEPPRRWPDLAAAARALRAAVRPRRWPIAVAIGTGALAVALAVVAVARSSAESACDVPATGWTDAARAWPAPLRDAVGAHATRWTAAYTRACSGPLAAAQRACLGAQRTRVDAVLAAVGAAPTPTAVAEGQAAVGALPPAERCLAHPDVAAAPPPATQRAEALFLLGRSREALAAMPDAASDDGAAALLRGRIHKDLQDRPAAEAALRRAVELASRDDRSGILADAQTDLALVVGFMNDDHAAGLAYVDAAVTTAERLADPRRVALARVVGALVTQARGDTDRAVAQLADAITALAAAGATPLELATAELRIGWVLVEARRGKEARAHLERALALRADVLGADHPSVAMAEIEIARADAKDGDYASAIRHYRAIIERCTAAFGETHPTVVGAWSSLGAAQLRSGDYAGAEASFGTSLAINRAVYGDRHTDVARAHVNLATTAYYQGKWDDALVAYRAAEAISRSILGGQHPEIATIRTGIALALQAAGRLDEASESITGAIEIYRAQPGHDAALADALQSRGLVEAARDDLSAARASLEESVAIQEHLHGKEHVELAYALSSLAEVYLAQREVEAAQRTGERALALRTAHGVAPQLVAETEIVLAYIADARGRRARARELVMAAKEHLGPGDGRPDLREVIDAWLRDHGGGGDGGGGGGGGAGGR
jgi:eukaryotic-like serine/threonine-protein kinase